MRSVLSVGIDETNHGLFPEIFCGVRSKRRNDTLEKNKLNKERADFSGILEEVKKREYSFLLLASKEDYRRVGNDKIQGVVAASLLSGIPINFEELDIFFDGDLTKRIQDYMRDIVSEHLVLPKDAVSIYQGGEYDERIPLVNLADGMARYLFRKHTIEDLANNPNLRTLIK